MGTPSAAEHTARIFRWLDQVAGDHGLPPTGFRLAYIIARHVNRASGDAWPSQEVLAAGAGVSARTVRDLLDALNRHGHITVARGRGRGHSSRYRLRLTQQDSPSGAAEPADEKRNPASAFDEENRKPASAFAAEKEELSFRIHEGKTGSFEHENRKFSALKAEAGCHLTIEEQQKEQLRGDIPPTPDDPEILGPGDVDVHFAELLAVFPKTGSRTAALRLFRSHLRAGVQPELILAGARQYAAEAAGREPRYIAALGNWLHGRRWEEAPPEPRLTEHAGQAGAGHRAAPQDDAFSFLSRHYSPAEIAASFAKYAPRAAEDFDDQ